MTILVTGGAGYIGSHMVLELCHRGGRTVVLDNLSTGFRWAVPQDVDLIVGDCGDGALLAQIIQQYQVSAVIHFAGSIVVPDSISDPLGYYFNNTVKSRALIEACIKNGVSRFIFSSTAAVYGSPEQVPVVEDMPFAPISPYGSSKMMTEIMLRDVSIAHDFNYVALRYFNVAGADPQGRSGQSTAKATHLIKVACEAAIGRRSHLDIFGTDYPTPDGTCIRDYIHVADLARAHYAALGYLDAGNGSLVANCGYGHGYSVREVIAAVKRVAAVEFNVTEAPRRAGDPAELVAGTDRIRSILDWKPEFENLDTIVAHALAWERHLAKQPNDMTGTA
ncbi:MAG: UDP-glucose 4-epimerase GalE [Fimbriimonadaceae bacterium]|nr:UDP-glucose 4-epimerase GalE [Alphaproteobacteria bacterium]